MDPADGKPEDSGNPTVCICNYTVTGLRRNSKTAEGASRAGGGERYAQRRNLET